MPTCSLHCRSAGCCASEDLAPLHPLWNGLRVRIGLHTGEPDCVFDPVSKGYDYYGPDVNVAARVEGLAQGGQILATESVVADVVVDKERMNAQPCFLVGPTLWCEP